MRARVVNLLATALVVLSAGSAAATSLHYSVRGGLQPLYTIGDTVTVDVFLDATAPITLLSRGFVSTASTLSYCAWCSALLPKIYPGPGTSGAQPSYILYAPATGSYGPTIMYPQQTPTWLNFPPPAGDFEQVNVNWAEPSFSATQATGNDIWIASLVYEISGSGTISDTCVSVLPCDQVPITGGPIEIVVPEPTTALLIGWGLLCLGLPRDRRR